MMPGWFGASAGRETDAWG